MSFKRMLFKPMLFKPMLGIGIATAALAVFSISPTAAAATSDNSAKLHRHHAHHTTYRGQAYYRGRAYHRGPMVADGQALPPAPEYGFLTHVPPNAVRMPGYTFVPGHGILGASCDLPTSACTNEYRDVQ